MQTAELAAQQPLNLRVGQLVEVRSADEILATLDENSELESLPFMPEMARYCGHRFTVASVAHKLCDTQSRSGMRKMEGAVHLAGVGARCDGSAHAGCQADCLIYWKEAWLKRVDRSDAPTATTSDTSRLLPLTVAGSRKAPSADGAEVFSCQATELLRAAPQVLPLLSPGQYLQDVRSGNVGLSWALRAFFVGAFDRYQSLSVKYLPRVLRIRGGLHWQFLKGKLADKTPSAVSDLQPGELVRVKTKEEILATVNQDLLNRGLGFDPEMARFCGRTVRVARRVDHIIDEKTGVMLQMKNPCIVLEGVVCEGAYHASCMRAIPAYWREIWLERVPE